MKKYVCPYCGEETISPIKKAFAGNQKSKGTPCPNCGKRCTNGMQSAIFHTVIDGLMLLSCVVLYIILDLSFYYILIVIACAFVINTLFDLFFFPPVPSMRID